MEKLTVHLDEKPIYDICFTKDFSKLSELLQRLGYGEKNKICIVTDTNVEAFYLKELTEMLKEAFPVVSSFVFQAGEQHKNLDTVSDVYEHLIREKFDRKDLLIALGGGVVGDLTGFTAATYLRGIDFIQVPTTLLSMVDSSIGGKTGVDFKNYKNMVGAFYMPKLVYMNLSTLNTLPKRQLISGMAEVMKHGLIKNADYFNDICRNMERILALEPEEIAAVVYESCKIKRDVVEKDPKEKGERALLNFGHTVGHAVEKLMNFELLHGECVAIGVTAAAYLSAKRGMLDKAVYEQILAALKASGLPVMVETSDFGAGAVLEALKSDKKMQSGQIRFILLKEIGTAYIDATVSDVELLEAIQTVLA